jgi:peroxiredoxin
MKLLALFTLISLTSAFSSVPAPLSSLSATSINHAASASSTKTVLSAGAKSSTTPITVNSAVPKVTFKTRTRVGPPSDANPFDWKDVTTDDLFKNKRVVLFALPGAFTPTCSSTHLPGYEKNYDKIKQLGVDDVYCLSVNDAFVMRQWGVKQGLPEDNNLNTLGFKNVKLIPDGAALFTRGMGMSCTWGSNRGFGERSWRYSAVINDGIVEKLFVEQDPNGGGITQNSEPDPFEVSDVDTMMDYLSKNNKK